MCTGGLEARRLPGLFTPVRKPNLNINRQESKFDVSYCNVSDDKIKGEKNILNIKSIRMPDCSRPVAVVLKSIQ
jgi:hypothetical protein